MAKALVIGCGYIGLPLALELKKSFSVSAWVHSQATADSLAPHGFARIITGSVGSSEGWNGVDSDYDLAIHCASSGRGGDEAYEEVFQRGAEELARHLPAARKVFVSSTSVYPQVRGEIVTEESADQPSTMKALRLLKAERNMLEAGATVVRSSGIYGPGRGVLFAKFQRGEAVMDGDGSRWLNQIHQHDLVAALLHLIDHGARGEIYNATDDTPATLRDFYAWCSEYLQLPLPPSGPVDPNRKRGLTSKRVINAKLRATDWTPVYPSFREGIVADHSPR